jgi:hypothetical protein
MCNKVHALFTILSVANKPKLAVIDSTMGFIPVNAAPIPRPKNLIQKVGQL